MDTYLGVSFVCVVVALCAAVLSRIATRAILDEIDKSRIRRSNAVIAAMSPLLKGLTDILKSTMEGAKTNEEVKTTRKRTTVKKAEEEKAE